MAYDYANDIQFVQEELEEYGRQVTLVDLGSTPANSAYPWEGPTDQTDADATLGPIWGMSIPPASREEFGITTISAEMVAQVREILLISPGADADLEQYKQLIDGDKRYRIAWTETFKPGSSVVFAFVGVAR